MIIKGVKTVYQHWDFASCIIQNAEMPVNKPNTLDNTLKTVADMTQINFCVLETMSYL